MADQKNPYLKKTKTPLGYLEALLNSVPSGIAKDPRFEFDTTFTGSTIDATVCGGLEVTSAQWILGFRYTPKDIELCLLRARAAGVSLKHQFQHESLVFSLKDGHPERLWGAFCEKMPHYAPFVLENFGFSHVSGWGKRPEGYLYESLEEQLSRSQNALTHLKILELLEGGLLNTETYLAQLKIARETKQKVPILVGQVESGER